MLRPGSITVVSNGVEVDHFRSDLPESLGANTLTFAGNLAPYQRIDLLLESFARVRLGNPAARLHVLTADDFKPFMALCKRLGIDDCVEVRNVDYERLPAELNRANGACQPTCRVQRRSAETPQLHGKRHADRIFRRLGQASRA